jgi:hypothetical protein
MFRFGPPAQLIGMTWFRTPVAVALIPGTLAFAARLYGLSDKPLWLDEVITHVRANLAISDLIASSLHNKHFPTYFFLASAFDAPIIDEWMLRLPSVIFGVIAVMLVAMVATEIKTPRAGLAAGTLIALAPLDVQLGQEARPYTLASCLVMLALWGLARIARRSAITFPTSGQSKGERVSWAAYTIGTIGALNVLLVTAFWLIASNIAIAVIIRRTATGRWNLIRNWAIAQTIIVLAWLPGLIAIYLAADQDPFQTYRGGVWPGIIRRLASQDRCKAPERCRARGYHHADCVGDTIDLYAVLDNPLSVVEHRPVLHTGGTWPSRLIAAVISGCRDGASVRGNRQSRAVLPIRDQAALGPRRRLLGRKCSAWRCNHH